MEKNKKARIIIGVSFFIIPVIHLIILNIINPAIREQFADFTALLADYCKLIIKAGSTLFFLMLIEFVLLFLSGIILIKSNKHYIMIFAVIVLLFIAVNAVGLIFNMPLYYYFIIPLIIIIYSLICIFFLATRLIRSSSFLSGKFKIFKPYFRQECGINTEVVKNGKNIQGVIKDISIKGCQVYSNDAFYYNDIIDLSFTADKEIVKIKGRVVRRTMSHKIDVNGFGVKFIKFGNGSKKTFKKLFEKNVINAGIDVNSI